MASKENGESFAEVPSLVVMDGENEVVLPPLARVCDFQRDPVHDPLRRMAGWGLMVKVGRSTTGSLVVGRGT